MRPGLQTAKPAVVDVALRALTGMSMLSKSLHWVRRMHHGTHRTVHQIARETGITKSSVNRIIHRDLKLKCFKKEKAQDLTEANKNNNNNKKQKKFKKSCSSCSESTLNTLFHSYGSQTKSCFMLHHQSIVKMIVSMPRPEPGKNNCQPTGFCENAPHFQSR